MEADALIRKTCLPWRINRYIQFHLVVDGCDQGVLGRGKPLDVPVPAGQHTVAIKTAGLGILDRDIEVPAHGSVNLACSLSHEGLTSAARSKYTEVWDGPSPINMWLVEDGDMRSQPSRQRQGWWTVPFIRQEAFAFSPILMSRLYYRVAIKHYVAFSLVASLVLSLLVFETLSQPNPSVLWIPLAVIVVGTQSVMVLRALARRQMPSSPVRNRPTHLSLRA
jgi:hypothetical protein